MCPDAHSARRTAPTRAKEAVEELVEAIGLRAPVCFLRSQVGGSSNPAHSGPCRWRCPVLYPLRGLDRDKKSQPTGTNYYPDSSCPGGFWVCGVSQCFSNPISNFYKKVKDLPHTAVRDLGVCLRERGSGDPRVSPWGSVGRAPTSARSRGQRPCAANPLYMWVYGRFITEDPRRT